MALSLGGAPGGSALGSVGSLPLALLGINHGSEYNNTKDQSSAGQTNWPRRKAQSLPLRAPRANAVNTNILYATASNDAVSNGSNRANVNAQSMSPISHVGIGARFRRPTPMKQIAQFIEHPQLCRGKNLSRRESR